MARNQPTTDAFSGFGYNVVLTRKDNGKPTLVNLFRMITADPLDDGGTAIIVDDPKAYAAAATSGQYTSSSKDFRQVSCTKTINVKESIDEIVQKQRDSFRP